MNNPMQLIGENRRCFLIKFLMAFMVASALVGCSKEASVFHPEVTVAKPLNQDIRNYQIFDGTLAPLLTVNLEARIPGYLSKILFQDGAFVKKDELLFVIEQDQYSQQVKLNEAIYNEAKIEYGRQKSLLAENATSQAAVDKALSNLLQSEANFKLAKINYGYTEVRAPFDGLMGKHLIDVGSYLGSDPQGIKLATIQKIKPIYVYFSINERDLLKYQSRNIDQANRKAIVNTLPVFIQLQGETGFAHEGVLDYAANLVATDTGSLQLRAIFQNEKVEFIPGLYAKVMAQYGDMHSALLIPFNAVLTDQQGNYVYILDDEKKVHRQNITLGQKFNPLVEVTQGLSASQKVVINGFINLSEDQVADPKEVAIDSLPSR